MHVFPRDVQDKRQHVHFFVADIPRANVSLNRFASGCPLIGFPLTAQVMESTYIRTDSTVKHGHAHRNEPSDVQQPRSANL